MRLHSFSRAAVPAALVGLCGGGAAQLSFTDVTAPAGVVAPSTHPGVLDGTGGDVMFPLMTGGLGVGDFDRDGYPDLFMPAGGLRRDKLFLNRGDGTFTNVAQAWGVADGFLGSGVSCGDFDGDGWIDVFVASHGPVTGPAAGDHRLYKNVGGTGFVDVAGAAGVAFSSPVWADGFGSCFGDYDLDGDLDLFVTGWRILPEPGLGNRLFRNDGDGTFTDVTAQAGVLDPGIRGFSPSIVDMDGDRWPEILVAADFMTSRYYRNLGDGTFEDVTAASGTGLDDNGMGSAIGDVNGDGLLDWYVSSIIMHGKTGNKLYLSQGNHVYTEVAAAVGVDDGAWGWGSLILDIDHDTDADILEVNGWPIVQYSNVNARLFLNDGTSTAFTDVASAVGLTHDEEGRALLNFDYDLDGDQDLVITSRMAFLQLFRNDLVAGPDTNWLRLTFDTSADPGLAPDGYGTRVTAEVGGTSLLRCLDGGCHYMGTSEQAVHFGLGAATSVDRLTVRWADGSQTVLTDVPANQSLTIAAP